LKQDKLNLRFSSPRRGCYAQQAHAGQQKRRRLRNRIDKVLRGRVRAEPQGGDGCGCRHIFKAQTRYRVATNRQVVRRPADNKINPPCLPRIIGPIQPCVDIVLGDIIVTLNVEPYESTSSISAWVLVKCKNVGTGTIPNCSRQSAG